MTTIEASAHPGSASAATRRADGPVALEGTIAEFDVPTLMQLMGRARATGVLRIGVPQPTTLVFIAGRLSAGVADDAPDAVERLVDQLDLLAAGRNDRGAGGLSPDAPGVVDDHLITALAASLIPQDAPFRFVPGPSEPTLARYHFDADDVLHRAEERVEAWRVIAEVIPSTSVVVRLADQLPGEMAVVSIDRADWHVLAAVDGRRSVADLVEALNRSAFDVSSTLHRLVTSGIVELA